MKIDSYKYIKPGMSYVQELMNLASEKGFIMKRINARELSHKLHNTIHNDLVEPLLKVRSQILFLRLFAWQLTILKIILECDYSFVMLLTNFSQVCEIRTIQQTIHYLKTSGFRKREKSFKFYPFTVNLFTVNGLIFYLGNKN